MYIASLESVKASSSLEIPCGDGNKDKVKRFGFRLFVYLMTATMEEKKKRDQFVPQQPWGGSRGALAYMEISFIASCYQWTPSNDEVIKTQGGLYGEHTPRQTKEASLVNLNYL